MDMNVLTKALWLDRAVDFRGVCTVVSKLLHIVQAGQSLFGGKESPAVGMHRMVLDLNMS